MKIKELYLLSNNLEETEVFYNNVLGMLTDSKNEVEIAFYAGETKIIFTESPDDTPVYHLAFDVPNNKLDEAYAWLKKRTTVLPVTTETEFSEFQLWNARSFYFYDNNGNLLEFICRFDLKNQSEQSFDSSSILYVSEIGLVTNDVPFLAEQLIQNYGLEVYSKQPVQDSFTALGDEEGLFILVNADRNWFPTEKKAASFPTKIFFDTLNQHNQVLAIS